MHGQSGNCWNRCASEDLTFPRSSWLDTWRQSRRNASGSSARLSSRESLYLGRLAPSVREGARAIDGPRTSRRLLPDQPRSRPRRRGRAVQHHRRQHQSPLAGPIAPVAPYGRGGNILRPREPVEFLQRGSLPRIGRSSWASRRCDRRLAHHRNRAIGLGTSGTSPGRPDRWPSSTGGET
jgi:hypothetical protein